MQQGFFQLVDVVDDFAQVVAAVDLVLDLAENFADFVFKGIRPTGLLLEAMQVGEQFAVTPTHSRPVFSRVKEATG